MNDNLKKIIELCDVGWIQKRWKQKVGDCCWCSTYDEFKYLDVTKEKRSGLWIWLPIGFNPETGNWQVDDLLMEILGYETRKSNMEYLEQDFRSWRQIRGEGFVLDKDQKEWETPRTKADFLAHNTLILKLTWLRELIEEKPQPSPTITLPEGER